MKHKHYDLIVAWADGAEIEYKDVDGYWRLINNPVWHNHFEYRIKPEPKPDNVTYLTVYRYADGYSYVCHAINNRIGSNNVKFVWDGETGKLKSAEVIK